MHLLTHEDLKREKGIHYSPDHLRRKVKDGTFPAPVKVGANRLAWIEDEIDAHLESLKEQRDAKLAEKRKA